MPICYAVTAFLCLIGIEHIVRELLVPLWRWIFKRRGQVCVFVFALASAAGCFAQTHTEDTLEDAQVITALKTFNAGISSSSYNNGTSAATSQTVNTRMGFGAEHLVNYLINISSPSASQYEANTYFETICGSPSASSGTGNILQGLIGGVAEDETCNRGGSIGADFAYRYAHSVTPGAVTGVKHALELDMAGDPTNAFSTMYYPTNPTGTDYAWDIEFIQNNLVNGLTGGGQGTHYAANSGGQGRFSRVIWIEPFYFNAGIDVDGKNQQYFANMYEGAFTSCSSSANTATCTTNTINPFVVGDHVDTSGTTNYNSTNAILTAVTSTSISWNLGSSPATENFTCTSSSGPCTAVVQYNARSADYVMSDNLVKKYGLTLNSTDDASLTDYDQSKTILSSVHGANGATNLNSKGAGAVDFNVNAGTGTGGVVGGNGTTGTWSVTGAGAATFTSIPSPGAIGGTTPAAGTFTTGVFNTSIAVGSGGSTIALIKKLTDTPGAITVNAGTCTDRPVTDTGISATATIQLSAAYTLDTNIYVFPGQSDSGGGIAHYRICNPTGGNITLNAAAAFNLMVTQ